MSPATPDVSPQINPHARGWIYQPLFHVFIAVLLSAAAQILMKIGADASTVGSTSLFAWLGIQELGSLWTWAGIIAFITSFGSWLYALRFLPLGLAFNLTNGIHVLVPIGSWFFLHEDISLLRAEGITLIILGIVLLAHDVVKVEEKV